MHKINLQVFGSKVFFNLIKELDFEYNVIFNDKNIFLNNDTQFDNTVNVVFIEYFNLNKINYFLKNNNPIIFLTNSKNFFLHNKLQKLDFHVILEFPIELLSFKEILKILIIKYNFFKKSKVIINNYEIDSNQKIIKNHNLKTELTEKELKLILILNEKNGIPKSVLIQKVWNYHSNIESHAFETNLYRLRKKMARVFKDKQFILEKNSLYYLNKR